MVSVCYWYISFFYMSNLFVVVVLLRSIPDWRRGWSQSAIGICAFLYMLYQFCIVVFQTSMLDWKRALSVCYGYMCIFQYVKLISCIAFP